MNNKSILVEYCGKSYKLTGLNEIEIDDLSSDSVRLTNHFQSCLNAGCNIEIAKDDDGQATISSTATDQQTAKPTTSKRLLSTTNTHTVASACIKKKKVDKCSEEEQALCDEILITHVMKQPMLYNPRLKSHRFSSMNSEKWRIIGEKISENCPNIDANITKVKDRWIHIRDGYPKRQRLNKKTTGSACSERDDVDVGPLDELLIGLNDVYEQKKTASNINYPEHGSDESYDTNKGKTQSEKFQYNALRMMEANSEKFFSAINGFKESFVSDNTKENVNTQDKVAKICDMLQLQLRELNDKSFLDAQIQILQVIHKLRN